MNVASLPAILNDLPELESEERLALQLLGEHIGYKFGNWALLRVAVTLGSWTNEHAKSCWPNNACLEFFGDAVIDLCAADLIWRRFPNLDEGVLTRLRASLVSEAALSAVAREFRLGDWLIVGKGDEACGAKDRASTLSDSLEAVVGAVFLDARSSDRDPMYSALGVYQTLFATRLAELRSDDGVDPKSRLQQLIQKQRHLTPQYQAVTHSAEEDDGLFEARVVVKPSRGITEELGHGQGHSLRDAEREAALDALKRIRDTSPSQNESS